MQTTNIYYNLIVITTTNIYDSFGYFSWYDHGIIYYVFGYFLRLYYMVLLLLSFGYLFLLLVAEGLAPLFSHI